MPRAWEPSKRAKEAIVAAWGAFESGDRWLRCEIASTARYTIDSLWRHGFVEIDPNDSRRFRLDESYLNLNDLTRSIRMFGGISLGEVYEIQEAIEISEAAAA